MVCGAETGGYPIPAHFPLPQRRRSIRLRSSARHRRNSAGANAKAVQLQLGQSSITVAKGRHTYLFPSDVDALARRLEDIRARSHAAQPRPKERPRGMNLDTR